MDVTNLKRKMIKIFLIAACIHAQKGNVLIGKNVKVNASHLVLFSLSHV